MRHTTIAAVLVLGLTGCNGILDVSPRDQLSDDAVFAATNDTGRSGLLSRVRSRSASASGDSRKKSESFFWASNTPPRSERVWNVFQSSGCFLSRKCSVETLGVVGASNRA